MIPFSVDYEQKVLRGEIDGEHSMINRIIHAGLHELSLIYYYTACKEEVKAWPVRDGTNTYQAAGKMHTDIQKGKI